MASTNELKDVIKETLENRGVLGQIKARIRAEVFNSLDDHADSKPPLSNENMIINELIREYLEFNKYKYSASVLVAESGQPRQPLDRRFMAEELNIEEDRHSSQVYVITQNSPPDLTHLTVLYGYCTDIDEYWDLEGSKPLLYGLVSHFMSKNRGKTTRSALQSRGERSRFLEELENDMGTGEMSHVTEPFIVRGGRK